MNEKEAALYLNENHSQHFTKEVTPYDIKRWQGQGRIPLDPEEEDISNSVLENKIPPKRGRPSRYTECDIESIIAACEHMPQGMVAQKFGCSQSYVSQICRTRS